MRNAYGESVRVRREEAGLTGPMLARAASLHPSTIWRIEHGRRRGLPPTRKRIEEALR
jgi:transcriptional regulator with XRE-family HTH domain